MTPETPHATSHGFTLIEIMIVIAIIGVIAAIAIPNFAAYRQRAKIAEAATDIKHFEKGFVAYAVEEGRFPDDSHIVLPDLPKMADFISPTVWGRTTPLGGTYNWEGPDSYPYAGIAFFGVTASVQELQRLDSLIDDGDLSTGKFRQTPNGRYTYIIAE
jgi:prepilin-type N-terminal cleavage/methylation domain-containing protein